MRSWIGRGAAGGNKVLNTPTHLLINWTVARSFAKRSLPARTFPASAVLIGSVAPDGPLYVLSVGGAAWFRFVKGWEWAEIFPHLFGKLFYKDPWWISLHNCLHSPLVLGSALAALFAWKERAAFWQSWWVWFFFSCLLHTLVDIPVHHDDGPLVFWPANWSYRFSSPVSYWDRAHYAGVLMPAEAMLAIGLLGKLIAERLWFAKR